MNLNRLIYGKILNIPIKAIQLLCSCIATRGSIPKAFLAWSTVLAVSIFLLVKKSDNSIPIFESSSTSNADVVVRLGGSSAYSSSFALTDLGNGFYLAKLENQLVTSSGTDTRFSNNSGVATYISTIQLEESTACTSYIPTSGAIATRLADVATLDLTPFAVTSIIETIGGVDQTPITTIPSSYTIPQGNINKIIIE